MRDTLRWSYALNQWNVRLDVFVRHEDQQRALKTVSACGFDTIELASGTGRWDNISRPEVILLNHGSHRRKRGLRRLRQSMQVAPCHRRVVARPGSKERTVAVDHGAERIGDPIDQGCGRRLLAGTRTYGDATN